MLNMRADSKRFAVLSVSARSSCCRLMCSRSSARLTPRPSAAVVSLRLSRMKGLAFTGAGVGRRRGMPPDLSRYAEFCSLPLSNP